MNALAANCNDIPDFEEEPDDMYFDNDDGPENFMEEHSEMIEVDSVPQRGNTVNKQIPTVDVIGKSSLAVTPAVSSYGATNSKNATNTAAKSSLATLAFPKTRKTTNAKDLALLMQAERLAAVGDGNSGAASGSSNSSSTTSGCNAAEMINAQLDAVSSLFTMQPLVQQLEAATVEEYTHNRPPRDMAQQFSTCVLSNGNRVFIYGSGDKKHADASDARVCSTLGSGCLLGKSIDALLKEVDAMRVKKILDDKDAADEAGVADEASQEAYSPPSDGASSPTAGASKQSGDLWVDKYSPKSFTQLLSPEKINREVLKSLKKWDKFVFKNNNNNNNNNNSSSGNSNQRYSNVGGSGQKPPNQGQSAVEKSAGGEEDLRPFHRVILLCGPPGTGKTTLAHIVAKHCGYRPLEINASDDRSPEVLRDRIARATLNMTLDADQRPNCIILDEIDGIDGSRNALDCLTAIIKAPLHTTAAGSGGKGDNGARKSRTFPLTRPLICICNDQFAPALRELRRLAEIFVFTAPKEVRLVQRLKQVCVCEGLQISNSGAIAELCSATGFDIRSSINNLQFAALKSLQEINGSSSKKQHQQQLGDGDNGNGPSSPSLFGTSQNDEKKVSRVADISATLQKMIRSGMKDDNLDLHQVWKQIFMKSGAVANHYAAVQQRLLAEGPKSSTAPANRIQMDNSCIRAFEVMKNYGDCQQVVGGIWENMHKLDVQSPNFNRNAIAAEAVSVADMIHSFAFLANDGFQVMPYVSLVAAQVRCFCATSRSNIRIEWPHKDREMHYRHQQKLNILRSLHDSAPSSSPLMRSSQQETVLDVVSPLLDILHPRVRALPMITLSPPEQAAVSEVVRVMESVGLSYAPCRVEVDARSSVYQNKFQRPNAQTQYVDAGTGGYTHGSKTSLQLEPAINLLVQFEVEPAPEELIARHLEVSNDLRHLLFTEQKKYSVQLKIAQCAVEDAAKRKNSTAAAATASTAATSSPAAASTNTATSSSKKRSLSSETHTSATKPIAATASIAGAAPSLGAIADDGAATKGKPADVGKQKKRQRTGGLHSFFKRVV